MKRILYLLTILLTMSVTACIDDSFTTSPAALITFSADTVNFGTVFTDDDSPTQRFVVFNRDSKSVRLSHVGISGENSEYFRLNVDGMSGREFSDVEIRGKDSIYVFIETTLPPNGLTEPLEMTASLDFTTNGVIRSVVLSATGRDAERLRGVVIDTDTHFTADRPYIVYDSLVVAEGATLTLDPGTTLHFHDKAWMAVRGTLVAEGTPEQWIDFCGDRTGNVLTDVSFDIMSRQWVGLFFTATSKGNRLTNTHIRNTSQGVRIEGDASLTPDITLLNSRLRNSGDTTFTAVHARVTAIGCEFAEAANGAVMLRGGEHVFNHCTLSNYYLFSVLGGPLLSLSHLAPDIDDDMSGLPYTKADFSNCILYGNGGEISHGELPGTQVTLRHCLLKSAGTDDDNFIECMWDADPLFYTVREDYYFDYRLKPDSPAIGAADPELTLPEAARDAYGLSRGTQPDLGAYVFVAPEE